MKRNMQAYLTEQYGEKAPKLLAAQKAVYSAAVGKIKNRTDSQRKTMTETILPRIALYKALQDNGISPAEAFGALKSFMEFQLAPMAKMLLRLDRSFPFFFPLLKKIGASSIRKDNWITENIRQGKDTFSFDIVDCLWYNTCLENGCPELCRAFCENDIFLYGNLVNVKFTRTQTLAAGDPKCDFCYKKSIK